MHSAILSAIIILVFCCVITGIYMYIVKEQLDESERGEN